MYAETFLTTHNPHPFRSPEPETGSDPDISGVGLFDEATTLESLLILVREVKPIFGTGGEGVREDPTQ